MMFVGLSNTSLDITRRVYIGGTYSMTWSSYPSPHLTTLLSLFGDPSPSVGSLQTKWPPISIKFENSSFDDVGIGCFQL